MKPRVLLAHSSDWPNVARLAIVFRRAGFEVEVVAPSNHPVHRMRSPARTYTYRRSSGFASLREAINLSHPDLLISSDDRVTAHLRKLHASDASILKDSSKSPMATLIERSIGPASSFRFLEHRRALAELSTLPDVDVVRTDPIENIDKLHDWADEHGLPAVLKLDGSWGGSGVVLISSRSDIRRAYRKIRFRRSALSAFKDSALYADYEPLYSLFQTRRRAMSVQPFISGTLSNCAVACWRGEVIGSIAVEVVQTNAGFGNATVVRLVEGRQMIAAATSIVRHLQISGLCGFDFVLSDNNRRANLIEINPRGTQIDHLCHGPGSDFPSAFWQALTGGPGIHENHYVCAEEIALFPGEWQRSNESPYISKAFHDVPYEEPALLRHYRYKRTSNGTAQQGSNAAPSEWLA